MKKFIFLLFIVLLNGVWVVRAQDLIAVQNGGAPSFYTQFTDAVNAANSGDTIYLPAFIYSTNNMTITKELHIIGVGHNPDSTIATGFTQLNGNINIGDGSSNGSIEGVYLSGRIEFHTPLAHPITSGFQIIRNNIQELVFYNDGTQIHYSNNLIIENIIRENIYGNPSSIQLDIQSNIISNNIVMNNFFAFGYNNVIKNNLFLNKDNNGQTITNMNGCLFENNVIFRMNGASDNNCIFRNNLSNHPIANYNQSGTNISTDNIYVNDGGSNIFVNYPNITSFSYSNDFHLDPTSPGKNAGKDGTDVGIYGGAYPWKEGSIPNRPHIIYSNIGNSTNSNGALPVNIKVEAQGN